MENSHIKGNSIRCWTCSRFAVVFSGKTPMLDCGFGSMAKLTRDYGFMHDNCPEYDKDVEEKAPEDNHLLMNSYAALTSTKETES